MINEYQFGAIIIDGKTYEHDVEVRWTGEVLKWQRGESHVIDMEDLKRAVDQSPEIIVIGNGESGVAKVTEEAQRFVEKKGIKLIIGRTEEAIKIFNDILGEVESEKREGNKVIGLFHLTC